jgi:hypothetical protein
MTTESPQVGTETSPTIGALAAALAGAQAKMNVALKESDNPHFKSKYADFASVHRACIPALSAAKIAVLQPVVQATRPGHVAVETLLVHESGEWIRARAEFPPGRGDGPQAHGSAVTYLRRYCLAAIVCVATDDDDGEAAERPAPARGREAATTEKRPDPALVLSAALGRAGLSKPAMVEWLKKTTGRARTADLSTDEMRAAIAAAEKLPPSREPGEEG